MQRLYLSLLREGLTGRSTDCEAPDADTQRSLFKLAYSHDLAHFVGAELEKHGFLTDEKAKSAFANARIRALYRYSRLWHGYDLVCELFEKKGIPYLPLKGALLRHLYPKPEMRTSSDIDLLVPEDRLDEAVSLLISELGFEQKGKTYHDVNLRLGDAVNLELHYNITEDDPVLDGMLSRAWEFASPLADRYEMRFSDDYFAFHVISHAASHFMRGGCGTKVIMDLYLLKHQPSFHADNIRALCEKCGLERFFDGLLALSEAWFGGEAHTPLTQGMEDLILGGGAFGTVEGRTALATAKKSRIRYAFERIFIPKRRLARIYPALLKYPYLLPWFHVKRWFRVIFKGRGKNAVKELSDTAKMPKEKREALSALLDQLGL